MLANVVLDLRVAFYFYYSLIAYMCICCICVHMCAHSRLYYSVQVEVGAAYSSRLSPSSGWSQGSDSGCLVWWQAPSAILLVLGCFLFPPAKEMLILSVGSRVTRSCHTPLRGDGQRRWLWPYHSVSLIGGGDSKQHSQDCSARRRREEEPQRHPVCSKPRRK